MLDGDSAPPKRGTDPNFRPMSVVAKRSPILATAELLYLASHVDRRRRAAEAVFCAGDELSIVQRVCTYQQFYHSVATCRLVSTPASHFTDNHCTFSFSTPTFVDAL